MPNYIRARVPGAFYFFTINLMDRRSHLLTLQIELFRASWRDVLRTWPFHTHAAVVLPDHLHLVLELPRGDADFSTRIRLLKSGFTRRLPKTDKGHGRKGERGIWQRRFWEHVVRDDADLARCIDYVHYNPVGHGYVARPGDWPYSSYGRQRAEW